MGDLSVFDFTGTPLKFICDSKRLHSIRKGKENTAHLKGHSADFSDENCSQNFLDVFCVCVCVVTKARFAA